MYPLQRRYIGLDVAQTSGMALWLHNIQTAAVCVVKGTPNHQLQYMLEQFLPEREEIIEPVFCMEMPLHFQNAITTRSLIGRYGFIKHSLLGFGYKVQEPNLNSARAWLGVKTKAEVLEFFEQFYRGDNLKDDHTDALLIAMYQAHLDGIKPDWNVFRLRDFRTIDRKVYPLP